MTRSRWSDPFGSTLPAGLVLYRTPRGWRWAVHTADGGILDGGLRDLPLSCDAETAQDTLHRTVDGLFRCRTTIAWSPSDKPDWWTGEVTSAEREPGR